MLREKASVVARALSITDALGVTAAFACAASVEKTTDLGMWARIFLIALPLFAVCFYYGHLYDSFRMQSLAEEVGRVGRSSIWAVFLLTLLVFYLRYDFVARAFLPLFGLLVVTFVGGQRVIIRLFARSLRSRGYNLRNIVLVGTGQRAGQIAQAIQEHSYWGLYLLGQVVEDENANPTPRVPILGQLTSFQSILSMRVVDGVVFADIHSTMAEVRTAFLHCLEVGITAYSCALPFEDLMCPVRFEELGEVKLLTFPTNRHDGYRLLWKRVFDIICSLTCLAVFSPVMLISAILIKLTTRGSVLFRQERVGINGRVFTCYKFRTMVPGADELKAKLNGFNEMDGPVFKIRNDPRVTKIGRLLRRTSVDELPQLFNVLLGHMSIVGPRPPLPEEVKKYEPWQRRRLSVRPGITCLWQVNGRNALDFQSWMKLDLHYIDNWSWSLDLRILLLTLPAMFRGH